MIGRTTVGRQHGTASERAPERMAHSRSVDFDLHAELDHRSRVGLEDAIGLTAFHIVGMNDSSRWLPCPTYTSRSGLWSEKQ